MYLQSRPYTDTDMYVSYSPSPKQQRGAQIKDLNVKISKFLLQDIPAYQTNALNRRD